MLRTKILQLSKFHSANFRYTFLSKQSFKKVEPFKYSSNRFYQVYNAHRNTSYWQKFKNINGDYIVYGIIGINVSVFGLIQFLKLEEDPRRLQQAKNFILRNLYLSNINLREGRLYTLITCSFTHERFGHLLTNLITLYFFGTTICRYLGNARFMALYISSGLVASIISTISNSLDKRPTPYHGINKGDLKYSCGASGHNMGLLSFFALSFPYERIYLLFFPFPAFILVGGYILYDLYGTFRQQRIYGMNIGHVAHLGGAFAGAAFFLATRRPPPTNTFGRSNWRGRNY